MSGKLRAYQVLDVLCGGTFYKVRHKVTNNIFAWRAYDCSAYSDEQIRNVVSEVKTISKVQSESLLRYYDTILHAPSKTLYFVLEYNCWRSLEELLGVCEATDKYLAENFVWYLLLELARVCKAVDGLPCAVLRKCISAASIFVGEHCELRVNCFDLLASPALAQDVMRQVGNVIYAIYNRPSVRNSKFRYSDDLQDVVAFLTDDKNSNLRPNVVLYHPTVLANIETLSGSQNLGEILVTTQDYNLPSQANKCDSEKAVELIKAVEPAPRTHFSFENSPIYCNVSPKQRAINAVAECDSPKGSLSPTLAALALELPGFVPRCRKPYSQVLERYNPQKVTEDTLSQQWMSRLIALRQREESLNQRERDLIAKEIVNSPSLKKIIPLNDSLIGPETHKDTNGITLPLLVGGVDPRASRRRQRRAASASIRRRKSQGYEDLDSSLSADPGDESVIVTAAKITKENMPRRNIFPDVSTKKVHFTASNPFVESDDSVTLTFYELENVDKQGYQVPRKEEKVMKDIAKFKYLDMEKMSSDKRSSMQWNHCSPSKQAKLSNKIFSDITNTNQLKRSPSKASLTSKGSSSSRYSMASGSECSVEPVATRARTSRQSLAPVPPSEVKKSKRRSLLPFKTPFKFLTSTSTQV